MSATDVEFHEIIKSNFVEPPKLTHRVAISMADLWKAIAQGTEVKMRCGAVFVPRVAYEPDEVPIDPLCPQCYGGSR